MIKKVVKKVVKKGVQNDLIDEIEGFGQISYSQEICLIEFGHKIWPISTFCHFGPFLVGPSFKERLLMILGLKMT